jgi:hypothetical protein
LAQTQPFSSRSVRNRATNPDSNAEKWSIIMQFAVLTTTLLHTYAQGGLLAAFQGGQAAGLGVASVISGEYNPSGKL